MILPALLLTALLLPGLPAIARTLPYWVVTVKDAATLETEAGLRKRLLKANRNSARRAADQLMAAGWVLIARGAPDTAIKRFNEAAFFTPRDPAIPHGVMVAIGQRGDAMPSLRAAYDRALKQTPFYRRHMVHRDYGEVLLARGEISRALPAFRKSLKGGATPELLLCIARLFYAQGQKATARLYFNWAERIAP